MSIVRADAAVATGLALRSAAPRRRPGRAVLLGAGVLVLATAAAGPAIYRVDPLEQRLTARLAPPASEKAGRFYPLGSDAHGRDMLARTLAGTQTSLLIGVLSVLSGAGVGVSLGVMAGHVGGRADRIVTLLVDVQMSMPFLFLALVLSAVLGPGIRNTIVALALTSWIVYARVARAESLVLRQCDYVHAAQALGASARRVMVRHVLPNILDTLIVVGTLEVGRMMLAEAALSFLGLGVPPPQASLGRMVAQGQPYIFNAWWFSTIPGLAILGLVLLVVVLGEALRRRLDPRTRT
jgi:peptide/nickel transport system permease protein